MPRLYCPVPLAPGLSLKLPADAARHVQVLRMQPGEGLVLFDGRGGQHEATIERMGRSEVQVLVGAFHAVEAEAPRAVHLAMGVPTNERMDWLVEKATELGAASLQPLVTERSVLRLSGERAERRQAHWQAVAASACEQCGRNRVPPVAPLTALAAWCGGRGAVGAELRLVLSFSPDAIALPTALAGSGQVPVWLLSGPEGGLSPAELALAQSQGFRPVTLGPRVLRADTAPLAALAWLSLAEPG